MIIKHDNIEMYFSKRLFQDLVIYVDQVVNFDEDSVFLIDGKESAGKSKFARQITWVISYILKKYHNINRDFNTNNIYFKLEEYIKSSLKGQKYQVNVLDESRKILNRRNIMNKDSRKFTDYLSECRKFNQFHIIILPAFHDIDKYIILWRTKLLLHCIKEITREGKIQRGHFKNYPLNDNVMYCWDEGRYRYPHWNPKKYGGYEDRFSKEEAFHDIDKLIDIQKKSMEEKYINEGKKENKYKIKYGEAITNCKTELGVSKTAHLFGLSKSRVYQYIV